MNDKKKTLKILGTRTWKTKNFSVIELHTMDTFVMILTFHFIILKRVNKYGIFCNIKNIR